MYRLALVSAPEAIGVVIALLLVGIFLLALIGGLVQRKEGAIIVEKRAVDGTSGGDVLDALDSGGVSLLSQSDTAALPVLARFWERQAPRPRRASPVLDALASGGLSLLFDNADGSKSASGPPAPRGPAAPLQFSDADPTSAESESGGPAAAPGA